jgi:hypothetical protein
MPAALIAMADSLCATASAWSLSLRRLGSRTWGGVALSISLVLALALLGPSPATSDSDRDALANHSITSSRTPSDDRRSPALFASSIDRPILLADPDDLNASTFGQNAAPRAADAASSAQETSEPTLHQDAISKGAGNGRTSARTETPAGSSQLRFAEGHGGVSAAPSRNSGEVAVGAGAPADRSASGVDASAGGFAAGSAPRHAAPPPWAGADWASDIDRAQAALNGGRIPAAYRDLVRGYFGGTTQ